MKATGIVRRIDDLGRVVIPKEIRRTMRIREGDPLEIFTNSGGEVIFKKYSPVGEMGEYVHVLCDAMARQTTFCVAITDCDHCIAASGAGAREYAGQSVSEELEKIIEIRKAREFASDETVTAFTSVGAVLGFVVPIIAAGDISGSVLLIRNDGTAELGDSERKLAQCCATFLSKQLEL